MQSAPKCAEVNLQFEMSWVVTFQLLFAFGNIALSISRLGVEFKQVFLQLLVLQPAVSKKGLFGPTTPEMATEALSQERINLLFL